MKMAKPSMVIVTLIVAGIMLASVMTVGCTPPPVKTETWCEYDLIAGQYYDAGTVKIYQKSQGDNYWLEVYIITEDGWKIDESQVDVEYSYEDFPTTGSGNPKIGKFAYSDPDSATDTEHFYKISGFGELDGCGGLFIAVHAVVYKGSGEDLQWQTAWAKGLDFEGNSWAMYIMFPCCKYPEYPDDVLLKMNFKHWGPESYWGVTILTDASYDLDDWANIYAGSFVGWCIDEDHTMNAGDHWTYLQDPYDYDDSLPWDKVNWILNHKGDYSIQEIQDAIWHFVDGKVVTGDALALVNEANANGEGFRPAIGQVWAIVTLTPQKNIIELDP